MAISKYDDRKIKQMFFESKYKEVKPFLETDLGLTESQIASGYWKTKTKGWGKEKQELLMKIDEKALEKSIEKGSDELSSNFVQKLKESKDKLFKLVFKAIEKSPDPELSDVKTINSIKILIDLLKVELGEPTSYQKQDVKSENSNTNLNLTKDEADQYLLQMMKTDPEKTILLLKTKTDLEKSRETKKDA